MNESEHQEIPADEQLRRALAGVASAPKKPAEISPNARSVGTRTNWRRVLTAPKRWRQRHGYAASAATSSSTG